MGGLAAIFTAFQDELKKIPVPARIALVGGAILLVVLIAMRARNATSTGATSAGTPTLAPSGGTVSGGIVSSGGGGGTVSGGTVSSGGAKPPPVPTVQPGAAPPPPVHDPLHIITRAVTERRGSLSLSDRANLADTHVRAF